MIRSLIEEDLRFLVTQAVILVDFLTTDALNRGELVRIDETHVGVALQLIDRASRWHCKHRSCRGHLLPPMTRRLL